MVNQGNKYFNNTSPVASLTTTNIQKYTSSHEMNASQLTSTVGNPSADHEKRFPKNQFNRPHRR